VLRLLGGLLALARLAAASVKQQGATLSIFLEGFAKVDLAVN
jgi:hypothetical protein